MTLLIVYGAGVLLAYVALIVGNRRCQEDEQIPLAAVIVAPLWWPVLIVLYGAYVVGGVMEALARRRDG